jgi:plasmid stabilization system protein ParE
VTNQRRCRVSVTRSFADKLDDIERFLEEQDAQAAFDRLMETLFESVVPNLERFPEMGRDFLARQPRSIEGLDRLARLIERLGAGVTVREYITGDYLVLYAVRGEDLFLLSIRHHAQLSYDFPESWPSE